MSDGLLTTWVRVSGGVDHIAAWFDRTDPDDPYEVMTMCGQQLLKYTRVSPPRVRCSTCIGVVMGGKIVWSPRI